MWIKKIWQTQQMTPVGSDEPIEILYWYQKNGNRVQHSHTVQFPNMTSNLCGPCIVTVDRSKEKTADAIIVSNGPLISWQKVGPFRYNLF